MIYLQAKDGGIFVTQRMGVCQYGIYGKTVLEVLAGKYQPKRKPRCSTLEVYKKTFVLILVYIVEDVVELVSRKLSESADPCGTYLETLQGWLLKNWRSQQKIFVLVWNILWTG